MGVPTKFVMKRCTGAQGTLVLFGRSDNQIVVGAVRDTEAQFGEDPTQIRVRAFLSHEGAVAWLKQQCREYAGREDVDFLLEEASQIEVPRPNLVLPGGNRRM
jgi:hypothetical protein